MISKRLFAAASALLVAASMPCYTVFAAGKEDQADGLGYRQETVDATVYSEDNIVPIDLRYYDEMPNVPYIRYTDFMKCLASDDDTVQNNGDGTYVLTNPLGYQATFDTENDMVVGDDYFFYPTDMLTGESIMENGWILRTENNLTEDETDENAEEEETPQWVLPFAYYGIDIRGDEDSVWVPFQTLSDFETDGLRHGIYAMDTLAFTYDDLWNLYSPENADFIIEKYKDGRPADFAEYNYNELCFAFDNNYGFPGRPQYTDLLMEGGLDSCLQNGSDATRQVREWLLSTDLAEYSAGLRGLTNILYDGGHTTYPSVVLLDDDILAARDAILETAIKDEKIVDAGALQDVVFEKMETIQAAREVMFADDKELKNLETAPNMAYFEKGDTAFFILDGFEGIDFLGWLEYYNADGEMPDDEMAAFPKYLMKADENPDIKNFVVDISANGGGYIDFSLLVANFISDANKYYYILNPNDIRIDYDFTADKNFDKSFDELDEAINPDLRFAVLTSGFSFSASNLLSTIMKDNGVLLLGEQSGGGSCAVLSGLTAEGMPYQISTSYCMTNKNYENIDLGIPVDYELFTMNEDGTFDVSNQYNVELIDQYFDEFYGKKSEDDPEETTEPAETTAPEVIETTPEDETTEPSSETTTEVIETTTEAVETTEPTTTTAASDEETTAYATPEKFGEMAKKDYKSKNGTAPAASETKDNGDGTYSIILTDENGDVLDTYTVDAATGKGTDSNGGIVDLPQTGNNSMSTAASAAAAAALVIAGAFAVGAAFRRKDEEE